MDKRLTGKYLVTFFMNDKEGWKWFDTEQEVSDFLSNNKVQEVQQAIKVVDYEQLDVPKLWKSKRAKSGSTDAINVKENWLQYICGECNHIWNPSRRSSQCPICGSDEISRISNSANMV